MVIKKDYHTPPPRNATHWLPQPLPFLGNSDSQRGCDNPYCHLIPFFVLFGIALVAAPPAMASSVLLLSRALPSLTYSTHNATSSRRRLTAALPHHHQLLSFHSLQKPYVLHKPVAGFEPLRSRSFTINSLFGGKKAAPNAVRETVIPEPDYRVALVLLGTAGALIYSDNLLPATPIGLLGLLLLVQTTRVKFVFDNEGLEVKIGNELEESEENVFVGGKNRWSYSSFVNWELWWPNFPVLVYFKEIQTKPEGQIHFFPVIFNGKQLYDVMVERAGPSKTSGPKQ